ADRAVRRQLDYARIRRTFLQDDRNDLRNDITSAADDDVVSFADVLAAKLVKVVQRGVADRGTADEHGFEPGDRCKRSSPSHLKLDPPHDGQLLLCRELMSDGPAWRSSHESQNSLPLEVVDFVDDTVDVVR